MSITVSSEELDWLKLLGPTRQAQLASVEELLFWSTEDRMSAEDRSICVRTREWLYEQLNRPLTPILVKRGRDHRPPKFRPEEPTRNTVSVEPDEDDEDEPQAEETLDHDGTTDPDLHLPDLLLDVGADPEEDLTP